MDLVVTMGYHPGSYQRGKRWGPRSGFEPGEAGIALEGQNLNSPGRQPRGSGATNVHEPRRADLLPRTAGRPFGARKRLWLHPPRAHARGWSNADRFAGGSGDEGLAMEALITSQSELRSRGFRALVEALGWANAVRFLRQYDPGSGDYTEERRFLLPDWDASTLVQKAKGLQVPHKQGK